jgi:hypothetical protein
MNKIALEAALKCPNFEGYRLDASAIVRSNVQKMPLHFCSVAAHARDQHDDAAWLSRQLSHYRASFNHLFAAANPTTHGPVAYTIDDALGLRAVYVAEVGVPIAGWSADAA